MRAALLSKAALCICPPAMLATTAVYVPPVRSAVHHATRPHAKPATHNSSRPRAVAAARAAPCTPVIAAPLSPLATFAEPVPPDGVSSTNPFFGSTPIAGIGIGTIGGGTGTGGGGGTVAPPPITAVPEPTTWSLMLLGFGLLAGVLRSRRQPTRVGTGRSGRRSGLAGGSMAIGTLEPVQAMTTAASVGSKSTLLAKAVMCVCPPAMMVATVAAVPQARKAVYAATMPREAVPAIAPRTIAPPCDPSIANIAVS